MLRATEIRTGAVASGRIADAITLDHQGRHRRRIAMTADDGLQFLLDLPAAVRLRPGDGLVLEDGRIVLVKGAAEPLIEIRGRDSRHLAVLAWQIGNRHLEAQIETDRIVIRRDHVIAEMLQGLGAVVRDIEMVFEPEAGAYRGHGSHGH